MLVLVVGPSGAGKDTLLEGARARLAGDRRVRFVRRDITRAADAGGEDHREVSWEAFRAGDYALRWEAHGLGYGIPLDIEGDLAAGRVVVANVSRGVLAEAAARYPVRVLEITAPVEVLAARLAARGRESAEEIAGRLRREVGVPGGLEVVRVMNDRGVEEGVASVVRVLLGALG